MGVKIIKVKKPEAQAPAQQDPYLKGIMEKDKAAAEAPPKKELFPPKKDATPATLPKKFPFPPTQEAPKPQPAVAPVQKASVGDLEVRPGFDFGKEQGKTKFLVHRRNEIWFEVVSFDEYLKGEGALKLRSQHGKVFGATPDSNMEQNYVLVVAGDDKETLTKNALQQVREKVATQKEMPI